MDSLRDLVPSQLGLSTTVARVVLALVGAVGIAHAGWASLPAGPQADGAPPSELAGRPVRELRVEGAETLAAETVLSHLGLETGAPYDPAETDRRLRALWQRGLLEDLTVSAEPLDGGVRLVVGVVERPIAGSLEYRGLKRLSAAEIAERLATERVRVVVDEPLSRGELVRLEAVVEELYRERGFQLAEAKAVAESLGGGHATVVVTVDEGERLRLGELVFEGNSVFSDARLRRALSESRPSGPISRALGRDRFDRAALGRDLERVREVYRRAGYKDAALGEPRVEVVGDGDRRRVVVTVAVEEGDRWRLGGVGFTGNRRVSDERLLALFDRPRSGWLGSRFVDEGIAQVRELYGCEGFMTAHVEPVLIERESLTADVVVRIEEGEQYGIGRIEIEGNTETRDKVIRRELAVQEGQVLDATSLRRSLSRLGQLEFFEIDEEEPLGLELDEEARRVDLTLRGREAEPVKLSFGGGYGRTHGLYGQIQYLGRNLRGRGETLSGSFQAGADLTWIRAGYSMPWLMDRRQSLGGELFVREETLDAGGQERFRQDLSGGRLKWGRRYGLFQTLTLGYTFRDVLDSRSRVDANGDTLRQLVDREVSSLELGYILDRVDSPYSPTRGLRLSGSLELAGGALGGDSRYLRSRAALSLFQPLTGRRPRSVLGFNLEVGAVEAQGGTGLSFNDRFYRGGEGSLRGFEALSISPRGDSGEMLLDGDGFRLGGDRFLEAGLEYHLLLDRILRLVAFADVGNVWAEGQSIDLGGLRRSAGLELRVTTSLFPQPLRFIWAENLSPLAGERFDTFQFAFGAGF